MKLNFKQWLELREMMRPKSMRAMGWPKKDWQMMRRNLRWAFKFIIRRGIEKRPAGAMQG